MNDDTILILAAAGIGIYALNKSGIFDATQSAAGAISGVSQGVGTIGREAGETVVAIVDPFQAASARLTDFINNAGRRSPAPGFYPGSAPGTAQMSPTQIDRVLRDSGVSTMRTVQQDIRNVGGTYVSPLFVGGSYTPPAAASPSPPSPSTPRLILNPPRSSSSSSTSSRKTTGIEKIGGSTVKISLKKVK